MVGAEPELKRRAVRLKRYIASHSTFLHHPNASNSFLEFGHPAGGVQAVARQTALSDPEHFINRFTDRIQAIAAHQDLLVRTSWRGVDVGDLVCARLSHFADLIN
jgi:HWE histidine kinase